MKMFKSFILQDKVNLFTLSFEPELEKEFQKDYFVDSLSYLKISFFMGMFFYGAFALLDLRVTENYYPIHFVRFAIVIPSILLVLLLSYTKNFYKYWQEIIAVSILIAGLGILFMIYIGDDHIMRTYYAGLGLVLIYGYVLIKLRFIYSFICSLILITGYFFVISGSPIPDLLKFTNSFFLVSINLTVMLAAYLMEYYTRQVFLIRYQLNKEKEKVKEVNLNLEKKVAERTAKVANINDELQNKLKDINAIKEDLYDSETRFKLAFESTNSAIWGVELDKLNFYMQDVFYKLLNFPENSMSNENVIELIHADDRSEFMRQLEDITGGKSVNIDTDIRIKDVYQEWRWLHCWGKLSDSDDESSANIIGTIMDIHKAKTNELELESIRKNLENTIQERTSRLSKSQRALMLLTEDVNDTSQELAEVNKQLENVNKELESFSYSISHDLKAPLRAIDGFATALYEDNYDDLDDNAKGFIDQIKINAEKMGVLIKDLLEFSKSGRKPINKKNTNLKEIFMDAKREIMQANSDQEISIRVPDLPYVEADKTMLRQVVVNLLSNAVKFSNKRDKSIVTIGYELKSNEHIISIRDNGVGFNMQYANKLFGVFQRLHHQNEYSGYGIGLSLVYKIITRHGGKVWAYSEPDKGATFYFTLPNRKVMDINKEAEKLVEKYRSEVYE